MKRFHLALSTADIAATITDYNKRLGFPPCVIIPGEYALWRNDCLNISVRLDTDRKPGELRHLGWETPAAAGFTETIDVNGITWEEFTAEQQAQEIEAIWPGTIYPPGNKSHD